MLKHRTVEKLLMLPASLASITFLFSLRHIYNAGLLLTNTSALK